jgi:peptidyl-prolyl cis-trans isomerase C
VKTLRDARRFFACGVSALLAGSALVSCGPTAPADAVAQVEDHWVTRAEAVQTLRGLLWRHGETWEQLNESQKETRRLEAVNTCVDRLLLEDFAKEHPAPSGSTTAEAEENFQQFLKQFEPPDGWEERAKLQELNATTLKKQITAETEQTRALESWLAKQSAPITEAEARAWYEAHRAALEVPEQIRASEIFLTRHDKDKPDRSADVKEVQRKLASHEGTFGELVAQFSEDDGSKGRGGDMGWFSKTRVPKEFADAVFALPLNQATGPIESHLGWHFVIVNEKRPARPAEFSEAKSEITALLETRRRGEKLRQLAQDLRAKVRVVILDSPLRSLAPE